MKKTRIGFIIMAIILVTNLFGFENAEGAVRTPFLYIYSIAGKDHQGVYKGTATIGRTTAFTIFTS